MATGETVGAVEGDDADTHLQKMAARDTTYAGSFLTAVEADGELVVVSGTPPGGVGPGFTVFVLPPHIVSSRGGVYFCSGTKSMAVFDEERMQIMCYQLRY